MKITTVPKIILPQHEFGVDWSRPRTLIAQYGTKRVWWRPGHTGWAGIGLTDYYPGVFNFEDTADTKLRGMNAQEFDYPKGMRLSRKMLKHVNVDKLIGAPVTEHWRPGSTVIVTK